LLMLSHDVSPGRILRYLRSKSIGSDVGPTSPNIHTTQFSRTEPKHSAAHAAIPLRIVSRLSLSEAFSVSLSGVLNLDI